jgi:hypothetical protein
VFLESLKVIRSLSLGPHLLNFSYSFSFVSNSHLKIMKVSV